MCGTSHVLSLWCPHRTQQSLPLSTHMHAHTIFMPSTYIFMHVVHVDGGCNVNPPPASLLCPRTPAWVWGPLTVMPVNGFTRNKRAQLSQQCVFYLLPFDLSLWFFFFILWSFKKQMCNSCLGQSTKYSLNSTWNECFYFLLAIGVVKEKVYPQRQWSITFIILLEF